MCFIPLAIFEGADITWTTFIVKNLIPATIGNIVGGTLFVGLPYGYLFGKTNNPQVIVFCFPTNLLHKFEQSLLGLVLITGFF